MSHRMALTLSIALTLVLATGVIVGRDRLFAAEPALDSSSDAPASTVSLDDGQGLAAVKMTGTAPRVIDIRSQRSRARRCARASRC